MSATPTTKPATVSSASNAAGKATANSSAGGGKQAAELQRYKIAVAKLKPEYQRVATELQRVNLIAHQQQEELEGILEEKEAAEFQVQEQAKLIHELLERIDVERELCEDAIGMISSPTSKMPKKGKLNEQEIDELLNQEIGMEDKKNMEQKNWLLSAKERIEIQKLFLKTNMEDSKLSSDLLNTSQLSLQEDNAELRMQVLSLQADKQRLEKENKLLSELVVSLQEKVKAQAT